MNKKLKIGINIDEILRAKWLQFDKYYVEEFSEDGVPEKNPYTMDFFNKYKFEDMVEEFKTLNENAPDDINPLDYQVNEDGEAPADFLLFKGEKNKLTAKDVYNRFMYQDYLFEIHGLAPQMYRQMDLNVEKFYLKYHKKVDFVIISKENWFTIPPTLYFLSKIMSRFREYKFVENNNEMWNDIDILITTDPEILNSGIPEGKNLIKLSRPYNKTCQDGSLKSEILQINDLTNNEEFQKLINYNIKK